MKESFHLTEGICQYPVYVGSARLPRPPCSLELLVCSGAMLPKQPRCYAFELLVLHGYPFEYSSHAGSCTELLCTAARSTTVRVPRKIQDPSRQSRRKRCSHRRTTDRWQTRVEIDVFTKNGEIISAFPWLRVHGG